MKDEKNYVVPRTIEYVLDQIGNIHNRAEKLIEEVEYLKKLWENNTTMIKWQNQIKEHNSKGFGKMTRKYDIDGYLAYIESLADAMLDAADLIDTEIQREEKEYQEEED